MGREKLEVSRWAKEMGEESGGEDAEITKNREIN